MTIPVIVWDVVISAETIRELLKRRPFEPLEVRLSNGDVHRIPHPEFAMLLKSTLVIGVRDSDRVVVCSLLDIASIERSSATQSA